MRDKKTIIYILIITVLVAVLGGLWVLIVKTVNGEMSNDEGEMAMDSNNSISYSAVKEITTDEEIDDEEFSSTNSDENAILATGNISATLSNITVKKTGDSDGGDNTSFYGNNSAILAKGGASLTIKNAKIITDATGANGVFSYGGSATTENASSDGTTVNISDSTIKTSKDNSGGIMTTGGGVMNAENLTIETAGTSSAAIRSDRGGGTVTLNMTNQKATGDIVVDEISSLTMNLSDGSSFKGAINNSNTGEVTLKLDKTSKITLTGDTYVKSLENADTTNSNINLNGYKLYVNGVELE